MSVKKLSVLAAGGCTTNYVEVTCWKVWEIKRYWSATYKRKGKSTKPESGRSCSWKPNSNSTGGDFKMTGSYETVRKTSLIHILWIRLWISRRQKERQLFLTCLKYCVIWQRFECTVENAKLWKKVSSIRKGIHVKSLKLIDWGHIKVCHMFWFCPYLWPCLLLLCSAPTFVWQRLNSASICFHYAKFI